MLRSVSSVWQMHLEKSINDPFAKEFKNIMDHDGDTSHLQSFLHETHLRNAQFTPGMQQDVHEAIQFILHELCAVKNIIHTCFTFNMKTEVRCCYCSNFTHPCEPCIFLKVPLSKIISKPVPLQSYIQQSLIGEMLTGENACQCDNCNDKMDVTTERTIMDCAQILFIQLLRFSGDSTKLNADVTVQDVIYINDHPYQLKSAICHIGDNLCAGHYIAFTNINGEWYNCNDNVVTNCKYTDVNGKEVYILCYEKFTSR